MPPSRPEDQKADQKEDLEKLCQSMADFVASPPPAIRHSQIKASASISPQPNQAEPCSPSFKTTSPHSPRSSQQPKTRSDQRGRNDRTPVESQPSPSYNIAVPTCSCSPTSGSAAVVEYYRPQTEEPWMEETV